MEFFKKKNNIIVTYLVNNKVNVFFGKVFKIKKITFCLIKKNQNILVKKIFFINNPNLISIKII